MFSELLPVVDANDRVVDNRPRNEIHAFGLRHRAVHVLVFNDAKKLFLQKRSMLKDLNKGLWDSSAAGHVDPDEDYAPCALREAREELGIDISKTLEPLFKLTATPQLGMEFVMVYRAQHDGPFLLAPDEIDEGHWFPSEVIDQRVDKDDPTLTETFKIIWRKYKKK